MALFFLCPPNSFFAQPPAHQVKLNHIGEKEGLASQYGNGLYQDRKGFLWICNTNCLQRYDGFQLKSYPKSNNDSIGISGSYPTFVTEDRSGRLWVITSSGKLYQYDDSIDNFRPLHLILKNGNRKKTLRAFCLLEDRWGVHWIGMSEDGLCRLDVESGEITKQADEPKFVYDLREDPAGNIWTVHSNLFCVLPPAGKEGGRAIVEYPTEVEESNFCYTLDVGKNGTVWFGGYGDKLHAFDPKTKKTRTYQYLDPQQAEQNTNKRLNRVFEDSRGDIWAGVNEGGIVIIDPVSGNKTSLTSDLDDPYGLKANSAIDVFEDAAGEIWINSWSGGIYRYSPRSNQFGHVRSIPSNPLTLSDPVIQSFAETSDGMVWVGTMDGLNRFDTRTGEIKRFNVPGADEDKQVNQIYAIQEAKEEGVPPGTLWIGTGNGLKLFDPASGQFSNWRSTDEENRILEYEYINKLHRTPDGALLAICYLEWERPFKFDEKQQAFKFIDWKKLDEDDGQLIAVESDLTAWSQTAAGDILKYDCEKGTTQKCFVREEDKSGFDISFSCLRFYDKKGRTWLGTAQGLFLVKETDRPDSVTLEKFTVEDGLPDASISSILEDDHANLWIGTKKGLCRFDPERRSFKNFTTADGLQSNEFIGGGDFKSERTGHLFFSGINGFNYFHPDSIRADTIAPPVEITSVSVLRGNVMERVLPEKNEGGAFPFLEMTHSEKVLNIQFAALHFAAPKLNQYAYQMEGFDDGWRYVGNQHEATYTNLDPGTYFFRVKAANKDGVWNEAGATLSLRVLPPWWKTNLAYLIYLTLLFSAIYAVYSFLKKRWQLRNELKLEQAEAQRLKELDSFKSKLYTNLTHEFRTPLTVILGMTNQLAVDSRQLAVSAQKKEKLEKGLTMIDRNGQNLLRLINQLLDLSKLEDKSFKLNLENGDIVPYLRYVTESFQTYANGKNLSLRFFSTVEKLDMDFDPEQIKQVMTNLISNAVKFTPSGGEVRVKLEIGKLGNWGIGRGTPSPLNSQIPQLLISIMDTGIGISEKDLPHIFDRFYQVDGSHTREGEGTGIGLAHSLELVKLMGGEIKAESEPGKGTSFVVNLPVKNSDELKVLSFELKPNIEKTSMEFGQRAENKVPTQNSKPETQNFPTLLIIEDNPDVVVYLKSCLENEYQLDVAYNGKIGIEKALESVPDLIVSDVMMPEKDGFEVCDFLKNDERTSHIPIVLLTAKADATSRIAGLRRGADAYLAKPFDKEELLVRLEKMTERQRRMAAYFSQKIEDGKEGSLPEAQIKEAVEVEDVFIQKVRKIVAENHGDETFALPQLCRKIGMSRSQLFRKMKALIGRSPSEFIRTYRLNEAKSLLENTDLNVSEVAWKVGFKDPAHFSKTFQEAFGVPPSATSK